MKNSPFKVADWLIRKRWILLLLAVIATLVGWKPASTLDIDAALETLFAEKDPVLQDYLGSVRVFGGDEVVVVAYSDPDLLTTDGIARVEQVANAIVSSDKKLVAAGKITAPAIRDITHLASSPRPTSPLSDPLGVQVKKHQVSSSELGDELLKSEMFRDLVLGSDRQTTALVVTLFPAKGDGNKQRKYVIPSIRSAAEAALKPHGLKPQVAGGPVLIQDAVAYLGEDGRMFLILTTILLVTVIAILFRSLRWIIIPLSVVHLSLIWTKATLVALDSQLTMISSVLTAMVTVIGIATVIHLTVRFREERIQHNPVHALRRTLAVVGPPCFWTSMTTAVGFGALMVSGIAPVRNFGMMMGLGALLVWCSAAMVIPGVALAPGLGPGPRTAPGEAFLTRRLIGIVERVRRRPWLVTAITLGVVGFLLAGIPRLGVEKDFSRNFRGTSPVRVALQFVEEHLSGAGNFEVSFAFPEQLGAPELETLRNLETRLREVPGVTKVMGLADVLDFLDGVKPDPAAEENQGLGGFLNRLRQSFKIPLALKLQQLQQRKPALVDSFWNREKGVMRIMLRASEQASAIDKQRIIDNVHEVSSVVLADLKGAETNQRPAEPATVTGYYVLLAHLVDRLLEDQRNTFVLAAIGCMVTMVLAFWDIRLGLIAMIPNAFPILMVIGAMGWLKLPVNMATAMLASVAIGMAVDSTIHYLYHFRRELRAGADIDTALKRTHDSVGRALVFANIAIVIGFLALTVSNFIPTVHFGILTSIALTGGLLGNLFVLPLLLSWVKPNVRPTIA